MNTMIRNCFFIALIFVLAQTIVLPKSSYAALRVDIFEPGSNVTNVVLADPLGKGGSRAATMQAAVTKNLMLLPMVQLIDPRGIPGGATVAGPGAADIDFSKFLTAGAQLLVTSNWQDSSQVEIRAFSVSKTGGVFIVGNRYQVKRGEEGLLDVADRFCADLLDAVIGRGDFFRSDMAFIKTGGKYKKDVWVMKPNGRHLRRVTNMPGEALSPTLSPDGRFILFSHVDSRTHALGVYDIVTRKVKRITFPGNTVIGPAFMPDNRVAVSLTDGRNPSIFLLNHAFQKERRLDTSAAIDVSPSVDASGTKMVFTSSRLGSPQIFLKDLRTGAVRRVTTEGNYNTDPSISPDGTVVAFARHMGGGQHRIFVYDLVTNQERQLTFGPGSDEQPEFSPDNYFIAFTSSRSGQRQIYMTTRDGGKISPLPTGAGDASFPAWGPAYKQ